MVPPRLCRALLTAAAVAALVTACSNGGSDDPATSGPATQAVEKLRDYGLTAKQAECVVDEVGAETVVEATDLNAFAEGQAYQDAAKVCI